MQAEFIGLTGLVLGVRLNDQIDTDYTQTEYNWDHPRVYVLEYVRRPSVIAWDTMHVAYIHGGATLPLQCYSIYNDLARMAVESALQLVRISIKCKCCSIGDATPTCTPIQVSFLWLYCCVFFLFFVCIVCSLSVSLPDLANKDVHYTGWTAKK